MSKIKVWIDDVRQPPNDSYIWIKSVEQGILFFRLLPKDLSSKIDIVDMDHDAGDYISKGGDYIKLLDWFEETGRNYPIRIHSMNPVGRDNMRRIIRRNNWKEII